MTVGLDGTTSRVEAKLVDLRVGGFGARGLYGVKLASDDTGWLVGDGGLVLRTENRGVVWQSPPTALAEEAADIFNFRTVAVLGTNVWVAGATRQRRLALARQRTIVVAAANGTNRTDRAA